mmetsp:Transcript_17355/g.28230  ORF Transcript_17355/g.28230 Transcript_17355/m.28230 type:complete len:256 (+) Transcript_17355:758-1525(+)
MRHLAGIVKTAVALLTGDGTEMDRDSAENWLVLADKYGVPNAGYMIGTMYYNPRLCNTSQEEGSVTMADDLILAATWFRRSAEKGHLRSMMMLGAILMAENQSEAVEEDDNEDPEADNLREQEGRYWTERAAHHGLCGAQYNLGVHFHFSGDTAKALYWLQKAADQGDTAATVNIASIKRESAVTLQEREEVVKLFWLAADRGHPAAIQIMNEILAQPDGKEPLAEIVRNLQKAAKRVLKRDLPQLSMLFSQVTR